MDDKLLDFLESSTTAWNNVYRLAGKPINISIFVDAAGGKWDLKNLLGPCGGKIESGNNAYRQFWYCEVHPNEGILINLYINNSWCWLPPWKEVVKK